MAIALLVGRDEKEAKLFHWFIEDLKRQLTKLDPNVDLRVWPEMGNVNDVELALVWRHPLGLLKKLPQLKCIASLGAGVDHLMADPELTNDVPIIRLMDPYMANDILQYVLAYVLRHVKRVDHWDACQKENRWAKKPPFNFANQTVGIMGLGFLGKKTALTMHDIGLKVIGWSNSPKNLEHIKNFVGQKEFHDFLAETDILVCMLPLTSETKNILNRDTFSHLKPGACLINLGRGEHLVEEDLILSLDSEQLCNAYLDVFREEPLPSEHPFWAHPKIHVTPHIASVTHPETAVPQLMDVYRKLIAGEKILNQVSRTKGY
jgi:glyoxylate/hydroxypyruvate reductase A